MVKHKRFPSMREVFFALCKKVDSPVSLGAWLRFEHDQLALAKMELNPRDYVDPAAFAGDYLVTSFLSKWKGLVTGVDLEKVALQKFILSEGLCLKTNQRLEKARSEAIDCFTASVIYTAKRKIQALLGPLSLFKVEPTWGWGPGASYEIPRRRAFVDTKMIELPIAVTPAAEELLTSVIGTDLHWSAVVSPEFILTDVCRVETVPKNAKTHRIIAVEPRGNSFLQKGVGGYLRARLKRVGIDLDNQRPNQDGARRAMTDRLATLDLRAASDTVAKEVVFELLPPEWAELLDDLRCHKAEMPDGTVRILEKFSSMGNAFTFELESLIFWALVSSVRDLLSPDSEVLVYGDDIICKQEIAPEVISILAFMGFTVNEEKSFVDGVFFESCGKHFFEGRDVTPIYQKETIETEFERILLGNRLIRYGFHYSDGAQLNCWVSSAWELVFRSATWSKFFQIPLGTLGDDGWVTPASRYFARRQDASLGLSCKVMVFPSRSLPASEGVLLAWALRKANKTESVLVRRAEPVHRFTLPDLSPRAGTEMSDRVTGRQACVPTMDPTTIVPAAGTRWVIPSWEFAADF